MHDIAEFGLSRASPGQSEPKEVGNIQSPLVGRIAPPVTVVRQSVAEPGFAEAVVVAGDRAERTIAPPAIIVELARGSRVSIFASASPALAAAALKALR